VDIAVGRAHSTDYDKILKWGARSFADSRAIPSIRMPLEMASVKPIEGQIIHMKSTKFLILTIVLGTLIATSFAAGGGNTAPLTIDTRTEAEWNEGHLEGAVLIPYDRIAQEITLFAPDKNTKINLYCRTGRRSGLALETLKTSGYSNLDNLGSMENAAKELGKPIVK
jgi:phage shock protein E